jgi:hypothetical protein
MKEGGDRETFCNKFVKYSIGSLQKVEKNSF